jgi:hypothetical protein
MLPAERNGSLHLRVGRGLADDGNLRMGRRPLQGCDEEGTDAGPWPYGDYGNDQSIGLRGAEGSLADLIRAAASSVS